MWFSTLVLSVIEDWNAHHDDLQSFQILLFGLLFHVQTYNFRITRRRRVTEPCCTISCFEPGGILLADDFQRSTERFLFSLVARGVRNIGPRSSRLDIDRKRSRSRVQSRFGGKVRSIFRGWIASNACYNRKHLLHGDTACIHDRVAGRQKLLWRIRYYDLFRIRLSYE